MKSGHGAAKTSLSLGREVHLRRLGLELPEGKVVARNAHGEEIWGVAMGTGGLKCRLWVKPVCDKEKRVSRENGTG